MSEIRYIYPVCSTTEDTDSLHIPSPLALQRTSLPSLFRVWKGSDILLDQHIPLRRNQASTKQDATAYLGNSSWVWRSHSIPPALSVQNWALPFKNGQLDLRYVSFRSLLRPCPGEAGITKLFCKYCDFHQQPTSTLYESVHIAIASPVLLRFLKSEVSLHIYVRTLHFTKD